MSFAVEGLGGDGFAVSKVEGWDRYQRWRFQAIVCLPGSASLLADGGWVWRFEDQVVSGWELLDMPHVLLWSIVD